MAEFYTVPVHAKSAKRLWRDGKYRAGAKIPILHPHLIIKILTCFTLILDCNCSCTKPYQPMDKHSIPKPLSTGGKGEGINFSLSSAVGPQLGLVWKKAGGSARCQSHSVLAHGAVLGFPRRTCIAWAGTGNWCLCSTMWEVWI